MDKVEDGEKKIRLVLPGEELTEFPKLKDLKLNLDGRKHKRGKNLYRRRLNQLRRGFRW